MAGIIISPSIEQKILRRQAAWKSKNADVKLKDILRQRCRLRIKERRSHIISQSRGLETTGVQQSISSIVQEEYNQFVKDMERDYEDNQLEENIDETPIEPLSEEEEWLMKNLDILFEDDSLAKLFEELEKVICPLCMKGSLKEMPYEKIIRCEHCTMQVSGCSSLTQIKILISRCLDAHSSSGCQSDVNFFVNCEEGTQYLYVLCSSCSYFDIVG